MRKCIEEFSKNTKKAIKLRSASYVNAVINKMTPNLSVSSGKIALKDDFNTGFKK
jgi:hypothetical protein